MADYLKNPGAPRLTEQDARRQLTIQAADFRAILAADGRATKLTELFDYLLEHSTDRRAPKEIQLAMGVFGKSGEFDTSQDSTVRAHIYRLRQRLDAFNADKTGMRLRIPKGEYRLILSDERDTDEDDRVHERGVHDGGQWPWLLIGAAFAASAILWVALWGLTWVTGGPAQQPVSLLRQTSFWAPIATHSDTPVIAASDFYMTAEGGPNGHLGRLALRASIQSERDLNDYISAHPDEYGKLHDRDIHRVPSVVAIGASTILSLAASVRSDHRIGEILPVSQISQDTVESRNVVYIAHYSQLGMLRSPILHLSGFAPGGDFDELKDRASGKVFRAWTKDAHPEDANSYDYGYLASFPGPSGNQIIVISGIEDPAIMQMISLVADKQQLDRLAAKTGAAKAFEALYQMRVTGGLVFDTTLLIARPLPDEVGKTPPR